MKTAWQSTDIFTRIEKSKFRSSFSLKAGDKEYVNTKGMEVIRSHAFDFIRKRLAPGVIPNDGKQTPTKGHPVFRAQHALACCCRKCLYKWHGFRPGRDLSEDEITEIVDMIMEWIRRQMVE